MFWWLVVRRNKASLVTVALVAENLRRERKIITLWQAVSQWRTIQRKVLYHEWRGRRERLRKGSSCSDVWGWGMLCLCAAHCWTALGVAQMLTVLYGTLVRQRSWWNLNVRGGSHVTNRGRDEWEWSEICCRSQLESRPWSHWMHSCLKVPDRWLMLHTEIVIIMIMMYPNILPTILSKNVFIVFDKSLYKSL